MLYSELFSCNGINDRFVCNLSKHDIVPSFPEKVKVDMQICSVCILCEAKYLIHHDINFYWYYNFRFVNETKGSFSCCSYYRAPVSP